MGSGASIQAPIGRQDNVDQAEYLLVSLDTYGRKNGLTWHTIRHEFVARNIENTGDPVVTQRLARHKDGRTTQG